MKIRTVLAALTVTAAAFTFVPSMAADAAKGAPMSQEEFLAANAKKPGWKTLPSGMQYHVDKEVKGAPKPAPGSEVTVHYEGTLTDGTVFDSSIKRGQPATFPLGGVIQGWQEGVPLMGVGESYTFAIPYQMAYGAQGRPPVIPPAATLIFKIELISAKTLQK
jgi:FKBP-type peptidyl-prolyl cis-trans isomerase FklB